jgi:hypothetical protein
MRTTVVPAQVTTVEDRIMGNLGFAQLALLVIPVFIAAAIFVLVPPLTKGSILKYLIMVVVALIFGILAIRIKGKIVLLWMITILRFNIRPKYYLFNKNTALFRPMYKAEPKPEAEAKPATKSKTTTIKRLALQDSARVLETIQNQNTNLRFEMTKKGALRVRFSQIKD